ncbi:MAG: hypothetical protein ACTSP2_07535 [Alphaproteobacteria bacterium]
MPAGCAFAPRCALADDRCVVERPGLREISAHHQTACWHPQKLGDTMPNRMAGSNA